MSRLNKDHFENICRTLYEISIGNLGYRLRISENHLNYDRLAKYINHIGEAFKQYKIELAAHHFGMAPVSILDIYLNKDFIIEDMSQNVPELLDKKPEELRGRSFESLLSRESAINWAGLRNHILVQRNFRLGLPIYFIVNKWLLFTCFCYFFQYPNGTIRVSTYKREHLSIIGDPIYGNKAYPGAGDQGALNFSDRTSQKNSAATSRQMERIKNIVRYMEEHIEDTLPNMKTLERHFGISQKKLSYIFREAFQQTPYAYYTDIKLQKAMELLVTTHLSIEEIIGSVGYNSRSGFYAAFKRKYGVSPGSVQRET